jgi:hypothetical protein
MWSAHAFPYEACAISIPASVITGIVLPRERQPKHWLLQLTLLLPLIAPGGGRNQS